MKLIYDEIRRAWVKATPEELVRQQWIHRMIHDLGYPKEWIVVEKAIGELLLADFSRRGFFDGIGIAAFDPESSEILPRLRRFCCLSYPTPIICCAS